MQKYDYLLVGAGLFNAVFAYEAKKRGKSVLVIEKRNHIGGNIYTEKQYGIDVHVYGAHIFHTDSERVWDFVNNVASFNDFINTPYANFKGKLYSMPFNMYTFEKMFGVKTPEEAKAVIENEKSEIKGEPQNLEQQAISLVGRTVYERLIKGYTEKQWGRDCKDLPAFIIKRIPVRFEYNNNYFNDKYQGIPVEGYTALIEKLFDGCEIKLGTDFNGNRDYYLSLCDKCVYSGAIDEFFDFCLGDLEYRSLRFENETLDEKQYQPIAVVNYTEREVPFTRIIEHKHFNPVDSEKTVITREYPVSFEKGMEKYYPVNDEKNNSLYERYRKLEKSEKVIFGGRLAEYKYYDMDDTVLAALELADRELG
ncbi:MAG: UDP-galactopyranose mutase [Ruminococcaceae bacterium]|jgi:UDP-galactopyranose mutase|nr:UDP-galactopyranose mutase [Oscillospiraceae bacterium]